MSRKSLIRDIQVIDQRLSQRQAVLSLHRKHLKRRIKELSPLYWLGAAFVSGAVLGSQGARGSVHLARRSLSLFSFLRMIPGLNVAELLEL